MSLEIGRYRIKRMLGQGAMGKVYLAEDPKLDRLVAIKLLGKGSDDPSVRRRFRLEARAISALKHPNIVELYDYSGERVADLFLVMEYVPGGSLFQLLADHGPLPEAVVLCAAHEICLALEHAHRHQVVHRDIKPENILLDRGRVVLTDFGVVKAISRGTVLGAKAARTHTQVLGTPGFMAPEQYVGRHIDARTDVFSLGAVLYNLATGHLPFEAPRVDEMFRRLRQGKFTDPRTHVPLLSKRFCRLIQGCLAAKPRARIVDAQTLREQILHVLALHGIREIRQELASYAEDPAHHAERRRDRTVEVLVRDLKVTLKDHDYRRARTLIERIRVLAPDTDPMEDISGVRLTNSDRPVFARSTTRVGGRWMWWAGLGVGFLLGALTVVVSICWNILPRGWLDALVKFGSGH